MSAFELCKGYSLSSELVKLEITDLAFDGKAVAHMDGKVVFLKGGLPGETVLAEIVREKARYNQGIVREIVLPSADRVPAICEHFDQCGGCTWQDLTYQKQLEFKTKQVADCLSHLGKLDDVKVRDAIGSVELFFYRNKMEFSFNVDPDNDFTLGLHRRGHFDQIFDVNQCHLQSETSNRIIKWMRDFVRDNNLPVYDVYNHTGYFRFLMIRDAKRTGQVMVNIVTNYGDLPLRAELVKGLTKAVPEITTIVHNQNGQKSNIATGEIESVVYGTGYTEEKLFNCTFRIRANSFFQTNSHQTETLYRTAFNVMRPEKEDKVLDLYCGAGSIGILLARYVKHVVGVELVEDAVSAARENAEINHVANVQFHHSDVKGYLKSLTEEETDFDTVIVDPPRAGLNPKVVKVLLKMKPKKLMYISCNPATFARDAEKLVAGGYSLKEVIPVDMFPHTMHIELVSRFDLH